MKSTEVQNLDLVDFSYDGELSDFHCLGSPGMDTAGSVASSTVAWVWNDAQSKLVTV